MKESQYKLGLVSVSFRQHTPEEILHAVQKAGLSCIEWGSDVHAPWDDPERLRKIAGMQQKAGIQCVSYGTYFRLGETPLSELEHYIRAAQILHTDILRLWCGTKSGKTMTETERLALLSLCRQAAAMAEENGVTLCMECHKKTFTENPEDAVWLMKSVNSPHFRMYWQPFQWQNAQENVENAKKIAPYARHIHVFNWKGDQKLPLGEAVTQWRDYLREFTLPRTLLLEFMPGGSLDELAKEADALRTITGGTP